MRPADSLLQAGVIIGDKIWIEGGCDVDEVLVSWGGQTKYYAHL
jgi:hypothetical protein